jgi:hypothetical protein
MKDIKYKFFKKHQNLYVFFNAPLSIKGFARLALELCFSSATRTKVYTYKLRVDPFKIL